MRVVESDHFDGIKTSLPATLTRIDHPEQPVFFPDFGHIFLYLTPNLNGDELNISVHQIDLGFGFVVSLNLETKVKMWPNHQPIYLLGENVKIKPCLKQLFQVYFPVLPGLQIRYHHSHHSHHFPLHKTTSQHQNLGFATKLHWTWTRS